MYMYAYIAALAKARGDVSAPLPGSAARCIRAAGATGITLVICLTISQTFN